MKVNVKKRILFVDDEQNFLDGMRRMLRTHTDVWDMDFVSNAFIAFDQICKQGFDAIVIDIMMPTMNGYDLLEKIRGVEWTKDIPVLILTGSEGKHLKQRALELGATDLMNKPVCKEDLVARINSMLQLKSYQDKIIAQNAVLDLLVKERTAQLEESRLDIIWRLGNAAEYRDYETGNHIMRVGCCCRIIAEALGMDRNYVEMLFLTSPLHDIGKLGIPDGILLKRGNLTHSEFEHMKQHCAIGAEILRKDYKYMRAFQVWKGISSPPSHNNNNPLLEMASTIALTHHERWNGTGYPNGLAGDKIPLESRIVAISDVFDALRSVRPYKPACSESESLEIIGREVGKHFDPAVYETFIKSMEQIHSIQIQFTDEKCIQQNSDRAEASSIHRMECEETAVFSMNVSNFQINEGVAP